MKQAKNTGSSINFDAAETLDIAAHREIQSFMLEIQDQLALMISCRVSINSMLSCMFDRIIKQIELRGLKLGDVGGLGEIANCMDQMIHTLFYAGVSAHIGNVNGNVKAIQANTIAREEFNEKLQPQLNALIEQMGLLAARYLAEQEQKIEKAEELAKQGIDPFSGAL